MSGAELLALARHSRGAGETDGETAQHLAAALAMLLPGLAPQYCAAVCSTLHQLVNEDMIRRQVHPYADSQVGITPWTR